MADLLLEEGYEVYGLKRWNSTYDHRRIDHVRSDLTLLAGDLTDPSSLGRALERADPDEVYNFAALSYVPASFKQPVASAKVTALGTTQLLEQIRAYDANVRFYQAGSSEMFGNQNGDALDLDAEFRPESPYGVSKLYAHWMTVNYRNAYDMFAVSGVLFNHESPRRGKRFVTRKISLAAAEIAAGSRDTLRLGNLDAKRDWGHAKDYVRAIYRMVRADTPGDYVIGTGELHSVRDCLDVAFDEVGLDWRDYVTIDERLFRPNEIETLRADPSRARADLDWSPRISFEEMIRRMVRHDLEAVRADRRRA